MGEHGIRWAWRVGVEIAGAMVLGLGTGYALDRWLGTTPVLLLLCGGIGMVGGLINLKLVLDRDLER